MLFVASILIVILFSNLFFVMLGWDGLGLISFFLIVYYQNSSSVVSGLFTLLINRIGDCLFLTSIVLFFYSARDLTFTSNSLTSSLTVFVLVFAFITKRAIFPFSPWLPIAIAAPTPVSALVHSSTLVTSGLFLIIRYSHIIYSSYFITKALLFFCVFTSFYAGLNSVFETDLKKLIALSTLRHLGFIGIRFACGLLSLSFFHLLVHALFKSLLFMTIGDVIVSLSHAQDIRYLSKGHAYTPFSSFIMSVCLINLLGVPSLSGFFRKDLILELLNYNSFSFICSFIVYLNVLFTFFYTFQLFFFSFQRVKVSPFQVFHSPSLLHSSLLLIMSIFTLFFGWVFFNLISPFIQFCPIPLAIKFYPLLASFLFFLLLFIFLKFTPPHNRFLNYYFSRIIFLHPVIIRISSLFYLKSAFMVVKSYELGLISFMLNAAPAKLMSTLSSFSFNSLPFSPILISLASLCLLLFIYF